MAQYIDTTNQDLLWNIFQKIPEVSQIPLDVQQGIFRNAISHFYQQMNPNVTLRTEHLKELNRQTITFLLDKVKVRPRVQQQQQQQQQSQVFETTEEKTQRIFSEKQKQYERMTAKPELPKPSDLFQEPTTEEDDGAILNMDERISQYQEQRSSEVPAYDPIPIAPAHTAPATATIQTPAPSTQPSLQSILDVLNRLEARMATIESHFVGLENIIYET
jgi:hypothetical protein